jgi:hypothetical protein
MSFVQMAIHQMTICPNAFNRMDYNLKLTFNGILSILKKDFSDAETIGRMAMHQMTICQITFNRMDHN